MEDRYEPSNGVTAESPEEIFRKQIEQLQQELVEKSRELERLRSSPMDLQPSRPLSIVNKDIYDKQMFQQKKRDISDGLRAQMQYNLRMKELDKIERENNLGQRLEDLKRLREEERFAKQDKFQRASSYKADLDAQNGLKKQIMTEQKNRESIPFQHNVGSFVEYDRTNKPAFSFNPITGELRDLTMFNYYKPSVREQNYSRNNNYTL